MQNCPESGINTDKSTLDREAELFGSLRENLWNSVKDHVRQNKGTIIAETVVAVGVGAGLAALTKNPTLLGATVAPMIKAAVPYVGRVGMGMAVADWGVKLGVPAFDVWQNPENLESNKRVLAHNVGSGLVDYTAMGIGGIAGGGIASRMTPELMPKVPGFESRPSLRLNESPRAVEHAERFSTLQESQLKPDVIELYEKSFPVEERQPTEDIAELVQKGRIVVHATRDQANELKAFSFVSMHDETATKFAGLDFIATAEAERSSGLGSLHLQRVSGVIKADNPDFVAMTLEMEHPREPGLAPDELVTRQRRARYYDRLDAPTTNIKYNIIDFQDPGYRGMAEQRAFIYKPDKFNPVKIAHTFMTDEGGYGLGRRDPAVLEFNKNNGYWEPPASWPVGGPSPAFVDSMRDLIKNTR